MLKILLFLLIVQQECSSQINAKRYETSDSRLPQSKPEIKDSFNTAAVVALVILGLLLLLGITAYYLRRNPTLAAWWQKINKRAYMPLQMNGNSVPGPSGFQPNENQLCEEHSQSLSDGDKQLLASMGDHGAKRNAHGSATVTHIDSKNSNHTIEGNRKAYSRPLSLIFDGINTTNITKFISRLLMRGKQKSQREIESLPLLNEQSDDDIDVFEKDFQQDLARASIGEPELVQIDIRHPSINTITPCNIQEPSSIPVKNKDTIYEKFHKAKNNLKKTGSNGLCQKEVKCASVLGGMEKSGGQQYAKDVKASRPLKPDKHINATCNFEPESLVAMQNDAAFRFSLKQYTEEELQIIEAEQKQRRSLQSSKKEENYSKTDARAKDNKLKEHEAGGNSEISVGVNNSRLGQELLKGQIYAREDSLPTDSIDSVSQWKPQMKWKRRLTDDLESTSADTGIDCSGSCDSNFNRFSTDGGLNKKWMGAASSTTSFTSLTQRSKQASPAGPLKEFRIDIPIDMDECDQQWLEDEHRNNGVMQGTKETQLPTKTETRCTPCTSKAEDPTASDPTQITDTDQRLTTRNNQADTCNIAKPVDNHNTEQSLRQAAESLILDVAAGRPAQVTRNIHCNSHAAIAGTSKDLNNIPDKHWQDGMTEYGVTVVTSISSMEDEYDNHQAIANAVNDKGIPNVFPKQQEHDGAYGNREPSYTTSCDYDADDEESRDHVRPKQKALKPQHIRLWDVNRLGSSNNFCTNNPMDLVSPRATPSPRGKICTPSNITSSTVSINCSSLDDDDEFVITRYLGDTASGSTKANMEEPQDLVESDMRGYEHSSNQSDLSVLDMENSVNNCQSSVTNCQSSAIFEQESEVNLPSNSTQASNKGKKKKFKFIRSIFKKKKAKDMRVESLV
eukprot:gene7525-8359_t